MTAKRASLACLTALAVLFRAPGPARAVDLVPVHPHPQAVVEPDEPEEDARSHVPVARWNLYWPDDSTFQAKRQGVHTTPGVPSHPIPVPTFVDRALREFLMGNPDTFGLDPYRERVIADSAYPGDHLIWFNAHQEHDGIRIDQPGLLGCISEDGELLALGGRLATGLTVTASGARAEDAAREVAEAAHPDCRPLGTRVSGPLVTRSDGGERIVWRVRLDVGASRGFDVDVDAVSLAVVATRLGPPRGIR